MEWGINMTREYSFKPAIKQPSIIPYLINGESAPTFVEDFNAIVNSEFNSNKYLKVLALRDVDKVPTAVGSNSFILPIVQRLVPARRIGLPEDLQRTLNDGDTLSIKGNHYVDLGVVLDFSGRDHEMALDFYQQLPKELQDFDRLPSVVVKYGLKNFDKGKYKLGLINNVNTQIRPARILANEVGGFSDADVSLETGLPVKLSGGNRTFYASSQKTPSIDNLGFSRLYLGRDLDLFSGLDVGYLADLVGGGRVILVRDASQNGGKI